MLAELLLAGVASAGVGLKSAANGDLFAKDDSGSQNQTAIDPSMFDKVPGINMKYMLAFNGNSNFWKKDFEREKDNDNDNVYGSQEVSPFFKGDDEYVDYDGFSNKIVGNFSKSNGSADTDYYRFYLYGDADLVLGYDGPANVEFSVFKIKGENAEICNQIDPDLYNQTSYTKAITGGFKAGAYCFRVAGNSSNNGADYQVQIKATYKKEINYSISEQKEFFGMGGLMWVSDFDPLDIIAFEHESKNVDLAKDKFDVTMESSLEGKTILQSSIYLWSPEAKRIGYELTKSLYEDSKATLEKYKEDKAHYEDLAFGWEIAEGIISFVVDAFLVVASGGGGIVAKVATKASAQLLMAEALGLDKNCMSNYYRSLIPEKEIMDTEELLNYLTFVQTALYVGSYSDTTVINLFSYYKLSYDNSKKNLEYKRVYDFTVESTVYAPEDNPDTEEIEPDTIYAVQPGSWMNGRIYQLKYLNDYNHAKQHIVHHYEEIEPTGEKQIFLRGGQDGQLDRNGYEWFYFRAPQTGTYQFFSSGDAPTYDTYAAELFNGKIKGKSDEGMIDYDDDDGYTGHFNLNYYMIEDEIVWIRVHGKNWKTYNQSFVINVDFIDENPSLNMNEGTPFKMFNENLVIFERDATNWFSMKFATDGYKVIQNYSNDRDAKMKVCDFRGNVVAETGSEPGGYANNGFLTFNASANEVYLLKLTVPSFAHTKRKLKVSVTAVDSDYASIHDLNRIYDNGDTYNFDLEYGIADMSIFVPNKKAGYQFVGDESTVINVFDTYTGQRMNLDIIKDLDKTDGEYKNMGVPQGRAICYLEKSHEYLVMSYVADSNCESEDFNLDVDLFSNGYYVIADNIYPRTISLSQGYFEQIQVLYTSPTEATTRDNWYKFENSGYRVFTLFGNCTNLRLELYDAENNLLAQDKNTKGTSSTCFICYEVQANKNYRVRIVDTRFNSSSATIKLTITLVPEKIDSFLSMNKLQSANALPYDGGYCNYGDNKYGGCNAVGYFVPEKSGYYRFLMTDPYPKSLKVSVVDTTSYNYIVKNVDYSGGEGSGDHGSVLKYLTKGRYYYIVYAQEDLIQGYNAEYQLRISYYGDGGTSTTKVLNYTAGQDKEDLYVVHAAEQTGYFSIDTSIGATHSNVSTSIAVYDMSGNYLSQVSLLKSKYQNGNKHVVLVRMTKGTKYMLRISKTGYTSASGSIYAYIKNASSTSFGDETDSIWINQYDEEMRYMEKTCSLYGKQTMTYDVYYQVGGNRIFQTFGGLDTILELRTSSGSLLVRNDNSGYNNNALISYNISSNTHYKLVVSLKNAQQGGQIKTTITPVHSYDFVTYYGSFNQCTSLSKFEVTQNCSRVFRFIPTTDGTYKLTLRSTEIDSYLYLIDPTQSSGKTYNDDGDGRNSVIRKYLYTGREYYIVACAYSSDDCGNAELQITKN